MKNKSSTNEVVTIRFSGDSGDGMQLTGNQFSDNTAIFGNDLSTLPDFPAEIRAPAGSLFGVSSFQLQFGSREIYTAGDDVDVLVAMNPAALKVHLEDLKEFGILILNTDNFSPKNLRLAKYDENPLDDPKLEKKYRVIKVGMTKLVYTALEELDIVKKIELIEVIFTQYSDINETQVLALNNLHDINIKIKDELEEIKKDLKEYEKLYFRWFMSAPYLNKLENLKRHCKILNERLDLFTKLIR